MDGKTGITFGKRFNVTGITRDKEYDLTKGNPNSKITYFSANANGEAEVVTITLSPGSKARIKVLDFYFEELEIKNRSAQGNQITKYPVKGVKFKEKGRSTLSAPKIWYDEAVGRLNKDANGKYLGRFEEHDRVLVFYNDGSYELTDFELTNRYETDKIIWMEKFNAEKVVSAVYYDAKNEQFNAKRFIIEAQTLKSKYVYIKEGEGNYLELVTTVADPILLLKTGKKKADLKEKEMKLFKVVEISGWKTVGTRIAGTELKEISLVNEPEEEQDTDRAPTLF
jgi:topoisomerase-4 subunit A